MNHMMTSKNGSLSLAPHLDLERFLETDFTQIAAKTLNQIELETVGHNHNSSAHQRPF
jgi:hypothetical protein